MEISLIITYSALSLGNILHKQREPVTILKTPNRVQKGVIIYEDSVGRNNYRDVCSLLLNKEG